VFGLSPGRRGASAALVRAALEAGDVVTATARRPEQLADLVNVHRHPHLWQSHRPHLTTLRQSVGPHVPITVMPTHLGGFTR
jgi:hypothetical protein